MIRFSRILAPTDFSEQSKQALPYSIALAGQHGASITLVHVVPTLFPIELGYAGTALEEAGLVEKARMALGRMRVEEFPPDLKVNTLVSSGGPYRKICEAAADLDADLIVTATHGHSGLKDLLLGSTTERVLRFGTCPVLIVRSQLVPVRFPDSLPPRFKNIIVPTDFSDNSKKALPFADSFAKMFGASIHLLHVIDPSAYYPFDLKLSDMVEARLKKTLKARLELLFREEQASARVRIGLPFDEIIAEARERNADLIVLSSYGRTGLRPILLGSTAERVARHAPCPVLVVRERGQQTPSS